MLIKMLIYVNEFDPLEGGGFSEIDVDKDLADVFGFKMGDTCMCVVNDGKDMIQLPLDNKSVYRICKIEK